MESMRQADLKNWSLDQVQFADLCSSLNQFFTQTGLIHSQSNVQQNVCHGAMHPTKPSQHIGTGMGLIIFLIVFLICVKFSETAWYVVSMIVIHLHLFISKKCNEIK